MVLPSSLVFSLPRGGEDLRCDLRGVQGVVTPIASWRWRDAVEPSSSGAVRFHLSLKQWLHVQPPPFREHKD